MSARKLEKSQLNVGQNTPNHQETQQSLCENVPFAALPVRLHLGLMVNNKSVMVNSSAFMGVFSELLQREGKFWLRCFKSKIKCTFEGCSLQQEDVFGLEEGVQQEGGSGVGWMQKCLMS